MRFTIAARFPQFLDMLAAAYHFINLGRDLVSARNYRLYRLRAIPTREYAAAL